MECLRADYLEIWAASQNLPLARFANLTRSIASTGLDILELSPRHDSMQQLDRFDSIISWYGAHRPEFRAAVESLPFQFFTAIPPEGFPTHAADFFAGQVCREPPSPAIPRIECPRQDGGFAVIHPFSGSRKKCWPLER
jgi:heptosyltransferase-3